MKFKEFDEKLRIYECAHDHCVMPEMYIVARLDGRGFTKLTKETLDFEAPFDVRFRDAMIETTSHLMQCGFKVVYGYTQSDEISLLFDLTDNTFERKERKINSVLAGEASAKFSLILGTMATFDCRVSQLPSKNLVIDYFRWRNEDAHRNSLNAYCYWIQRNEGVSPSKATSYMEKKTIAEKNEFLFQKGVNFNDLDKWKKRGSGIYWEHYEKEAKNPMTGESVLAKRKRLKVDTHLPMKEEYSEFMLRYILS